MTQPASKGSATALLRRRAPRLDGPYDDESHDRTPVAIDGTLALAFPPSTAPAVPLRLVPPAGGIDPETESADLPDVRRAQPIPDPRRLAGPLAQAIAEVLTGF